MLTSLSDRPIKNNISRIATVNNTMTIITPTAITAKATTTTTAVTIGHYKSYLEQGHQIERTNPTYTTHISRLYKDIITKKAPTSTMGGIMSTSALSVTLILMTT